MSDTPKNCPRCGSDAIGYGFSSPTRQGDVCCYADGCEAITISETEGEAIKLWNSGVWHYRPIEWDDFGNPCEFEWKEPRQ